MKTVLIIVGIILATMLWQLISSRTIGTPAVALSDLKYSTKEHCGKAANVRAKVSSLIGDDGYELEQDGVTLRVAVGKPGGKVRPLPSVGKNVEGHLFVVCSSGSALVMGTSFSELPD